MSDSYTIPFSRPQKTQYRERTPVIALIGNPNTGKTTLFNALTGLQVKTANYPGTTVECRHANLQEGDRPITLLDLPGIYSLSSDTPEEKIVLDLLLQRATPPDGIKPAPDRHILDGMVLVIDALRLERSLFMATQLREFNVPIIMALNKMDLAAKRGIHIDPEQLERETGFPVIPISAKLGDGLPDLIRAMTSDHMAVTTPPPPCERCSGCPFQSGFAWSCRVAQTCMHRPPQTRSARSELADRLLTHPAGGWAVFAAVMLGLFYLVFHLAEIPMELIEGVFGDIGAWLNARLPEGWLRSLLVDGIIGGVGGILVFLPQIAILFFLLALLEDTGYLARAALVVDRFMRKIGLPGKAFVPLLSAHACAIPAIMATRVIENPKDRLLTILIAPLMSCAARIPVYTMLIALLFPNDPLRAALTFLAAYFIGLSAALGVAWLFRRTLFRGESAPLLLELPDFHIPSLRTALRSMLERSWIFIQQAGTIILLISMILWALAYFPRPDAQATDALEQSYAGRMGRFMEPVIKPLGYDWQIGIGLITSLAAREVIVPTLSVVYGVGSEHDNEDEEISPSLLNTLRSATRSDGTPVFTVSTCLSLLVFYILAAQCLPTQVVTRRETNSWRWPIFQFTYMNTLAYVAALIVYQVASRLV